MLRVKAVPGYMPLGNHRRGGSPPSSSSVVQHSNPGSCNQVRHNSILPQATYPHKQTQKVWHRVSTMLQHCYTSRVAAVGNISLSYTHSFPPSTSTMAVRARMPHRLCRRTATHPKAKPQALSPDLKAFHLVQCLHARSCCPHALALITPARCHNNGSDNRVNISNVC